MEFLLLIAFPVVGGLINGKSGAVSAFATYLIAGFLELIFHNSLLTIAVIVIGFIIIIMDGKQRHTQVAYNTPKKSESEWINTYAEYWIRVIDDFSHLKNVSERTMLIYYDYESKKMAAEVKMSYAGRLIQHYFSMVKPHGWDFVNTFFYGEGYKPHSDALVDALEDTGRDGGGDLTMKMSFICEYAQKEKVLGLILGNGQQKFPGAVTGKQRDSCVWVKFD